MFGAELANTVPAVPSAHCVGTAPAFVMYADQSGVGAAMPTQVNCCTALARPVLSIAVPMSVAFGVLWKMPTPPRTTARGPRTAPSKPPIRAAVPYVHENPTRGLR